MRLSVYPSCILKTFQPYMKHLNILTCEKPMAQKAFCLHGAIFINPATYTCLGILICLVFAVSIVLFK